jgi:secondary thiamine-phosphate synthase enzyme
MIQQIEFTLKGKNRGFHLITDEVLQHLPKLPQIGLLHLFLKHTSAGLSINENADPDVQTDLNSIFDWLVCEREPYYTRTDKHPVEEVIKKLPIKETSRIL